MECSANYAELHPPLLSVWNAAVCRVNEPLTVNATSFKAGDVIVVSWNFTRTTVAATDQIQASCSCLTCPCPSPYPPSPSVQQTAWKCLGSQTQLCLLSVLVAAVHSSYQHLPGHCPVHTQPNQVQGGRRQHHSRQRHVSEGRSCSLKTSRSCNYRSICSSSNLSQQLLVARTPPLTHAHTHINPHQPTPLPASLPLQFHPAQSPPRLAGGFCLFCRRPEGQHPGHHQRSAQLAHRRQGGAGDRRHQDERAVADQERQPAAGGVRHQSWCAVLQRLRQHNHLHQGRHHFGGYSGHAHCGHQPDDIGAQGLERPWLHPQGHADGPEAQHHLLLPGGGRCRQQLLLDILRRLLLHHTPCSRLQRQLCVAHGC